MLHISRSTFVGTRFNEGLQLNMPTTMHVAYCGQQVTTSETAPETTADCDLCQQAFGWDEIDKMEVVNENHA